MSRFTRIYTVCHSTFDFGLKSGHVQIQGLKSPVQKFTVDMVNISRYTVLIIRIETDMPEQTAQTQTSRKHTYIILIPLNPTFI